MGTQFKDVADMFKRLPKAAERARAFVSKAARFVGYALNKRRDL